MAILITGAGLVGAHFAQRAAASGERIVFYDLNPSTEYLASILGDRSYEVVRGDVRDLPALTDAMQTHKVDTVLHTAGLIAAKVAANSYTGVLINVLGATNVAEAARLSKVRKVLNCATIGVYDWSVPHPEPLRETFPTGGAGLYGATKVSAESLLRAYARQYGFEIVSLRLTGVFGRGHFVGGSAQGETMHEMLVRPLRGETVTLPRARLLTLEYIYAKDVARAIELAWQASPLPHQVYNVGTGRLYTGEEIIATIRKHIPEAQFELTPGPDDDRIVTQRAQCLDVTRSRDELGFTAEYDLDAGIAEYVRELRAAAA